jgi:hypothetical protein
MESHYLFLYKDINTLRKSYSKYCKSALIKSNEIVLILSYTDSIQDTFVTLSNTDIDVKNFRDEGSLVIVESRKGFYGMLDRFVGITIMVKMLLQRVEKLQKNGLMVISDMGLFFHLDRIEDLIVYEKQISKSVSKLNLRVICAYSMPDFISLSEEQKRLLESIHDTISSLDLEVS